jgi:hypothetical protein
MIYVFEGSRNSGKTFLSDHISKTFSLPKYKFDFVNYFNDLKLNSHNSKETHLFAMGKELMLMQISRDLGIEDLILDRGIITVFSWALLENRISKEEVRDQIKMVCDRNLMKGITIIHIEGNNPDKSSRNKDNWDHLDFSLEEKECCDFVIEEFKNNGFNVFCFKNNFTDKDKENIEFIFNSIKK